MPSVPGQQQVQQHQVGPVCLDQAGHLFRLPGHERAVARVLENAPHVPQCLRVILHHQDVGLLPSGAP